MLADFHIFLGDKNLNADLETLTFRKEMREEAKKASRERDHLHWKVRKLVLL